MINILASDFSSTSTLIPFLALTYRSHLPHNNGVGVVVTLILPGGGGGGGYPYGPPLSMGGGGGGAISGMGCGVPEETGGGCPSLRRLKGSKVGGGSAK